MSFRACRGIPEVFTDESVFSGKLKGILQLRFASFRMTGVGVIPKSVVIPSLSRDP
jgi:hypothetical protein